MSKEKHWDYEDDHDYDDDFDYKANEYVYWYGKYKPKEEIESLFSEKKPNASGLKALLLIAGVTFVVVKAVTYVKDNWEFTFNTSIEKPNEK